MRPHYKATKDTEKPSQYLISAAVVVVWLYFCFFLSYFGTKIETALCLEDPRRREMKDKQAEMMKRGKDGCFLLLRVMDL